MMNDRFIANMAKVISEATRGYVMAIVFGESIPKNLSLDKQVEMVIKDVLKGHLVILWEPEELVNYWNGHADEVYMDQGYKIKKIDVEDAKNILENIKMNYDHDTGVFWDVIHNVILNYVS